MAWYQSKSLRRRRGQRQRLGRRPRHRLRAPAGRQAVGQLRRDRLPRRGEERDRRHRDGRARRDQQLRHQLGDWASPGRPAVLRRRRARSDFMPDHFRSFAAATGHAGVDRACSIAPTRSSTASRRRYSPTTGLLPDFVVDPLGTPAPVAGELPRGRQRRRLRLQRLPRPVASRHRLPGLRRRARQDRGAAHRRRWIRAATGGDPANIRSGYQLNGTLSPAPTISRWRSSRRSASARWSTPPTRAWLNAIWDLVVAHADLDAEGYYENTLKLLSMIVMSGNWWRRESVSGGCTPRAGTPLCTSGGAAHGDPDHARPPRRARRTTRPCS